MRKNRRLSATIVLLTALGVGVLLGTRDVRGQGVAITPTPTPLTITPIPLKSPNGTEVFPVDVAPDPSGLVYFIGFSATGILAGHFTPAGDVTAFPLPPSGTNVTVPQSIAIGGDGNARFTYITLTPAQSPVESGVIKMTPTGEFTKYTLSNPSACVAGCPITPPGPDGNNWFAQKAAFRIGNISGNGAIKEFSTPSGQTPIAITTGGGKILVASPKGLNVFTTDGAVTTLLDPNPSALHQGITSSTDGGVYMTDSGTNSILRVNLATGEYRRFNILIPNSFPTAVVSNPTTIIAFVETGGRSIGLFDSSTSVITNFPMPNGSSPIQIKASQTTSPAAYVIGLDPNDDPHLFGLKFGAPPAQTTLSVKKSVFSEIDSFRSQGPITYIIVIENTGNEPATNVQVTDVLDATLQLDRNDSGCVLVGRTVTCNKPVIPPHQTNQIVISLSPSIAPTDPETTVPNTARAQASNAPEAISNTVAVKVLPPRDAIGFIELLLPSLGF